MSIAEALFLGALEGFTEFLPISSTAHLLLASQVFAIPETEFFKSFAIVIQLGAILAVVVLYAGKLLRDGETNKRILVAFIPTAIVGFLLYGLIKNYFFEEVPLMLVMLFVGGVLMIVFERWYKARKSGEEALAQIPYYKAIIIGLAQSLAIIPGVSRAAATIIGGMLLGLERKAIVEFSFLLAIPTVAAAAGYDFVKTAPQFSAGEFGLLAIGFVASFLFALLGIRFLLRLVKHHPFTGFGLYRIAIAALFFSTMMLWSE